MQVTLFRRAASSAAASAVLLGALVALPSPASAHGVGGSAIIDNGTIQLGVWDDGHLNVPGGTPSSQTGTTTVGLRYLPTGAEATAPGCECEGWGVADATSGVSGYANESVDGVVNITPVSFTVDATSAVSVVDVGTTLRVTHDYHPSPDTPNLYEVDVLVENLSADPVDLRYRRVMDWDIEPTAFNEFSTIQGAAGAADVLFTSNDGFASANPLSGPSDLGQTGDFVDAGPDDHGALFDFGFGNLAAGATKAFTTFYGAAANETDALAALGAVGAEIYSFGQPSSSDPTVGSPNTFIFAFAGVGGTPIVDPPDTVTADAGGPYSGAEGSPIAVDGTVTGAPTTTTWSYAADPSVDAGAACVFADPNAVDTTVTCTDDGSYTLTLTADSVFDTAALTVANADPVVAISSPADMSSFPVGGTVNVAANVSDAGSNDTHTCSIDWGDGSVEPGVLAGGTCSGSHAYAATGVYDISVSVTDDDSGVGSDTISVVIVDDATKVSGGGFVIEGGRTSFGFIAKDDGAGGQSGQLQVRTPGKEKFHGDSVTGLVVSGNTATWQGDGRWNGTDGYTFEIAVVDNRDGGGKLAKKGAPDTITVTIKDAGGTVVFSTSGALQGGNIRIH